MQGLSIARYSTCCPQYMPFAPVDGCMHAQDAVYAARAEEGHTEHFVLNSPCTPERLRMACCDGLTAPFAQPDYVPLSSF